MKDYWKSPTSNVLSLSKLLAVLSGVALWILISILISGGNVSAFPFNKCSPLLKKLLIDGPITEEQNFVLTQLADQIATREIRLSELLDHQKNYITTINFSDESVLAKIKKLTGLDLIEKYKSQQNDPYPKMWPDTVRQYYGRSLVAKIADLKMKDVFLYGKTLYWATFNREPTMIELNLLQRELLKLNSGRFETSKNLAKDMKLFSIPKVKAIFKAYDIYQSLIKKDKKEAKQKAIFELMSSDFSQTLAKSIVIQFGTPNEKGDACCEAYRQTGLPCTSCPRRITELVQIKIASRALGVQIKPPTQEADSDGLILFETDPH